MLRHGGHGDGGIGSTHADTYTQAQCYAHTDVQRYTYAKAHCYSHAKAYG